MNKFIAILVTLLAIPSLSQACSVDSFVNGVERNVRGCNSEITNYGAPQPGGECVSLLSSAGMLSDYVNEGLYGCSSSQKKRAESATSSAISTLRRAQSR